MNTAIYPSLKNKRVFITGGATGIGASMVARFAAQSKAVAFLDYDAANGQALASSLPNVRFYHADVRDVKALQQAIEKATNDMAGLDVFISNAANDERHAFATLTPEYWDNNIAINLRPHVFGAQTASRLISNQATGSIILMGSVSWMRSTAGMVSYTASKAATYGLTRTLAQELGPQGLRVNCVVPGPIQTAKQDALVTSPTLIQSFLDAQALKFRLQADDVTAMVLFLAADDSRACSGQSFIVDGGIS